MYDTASMKLLNNGDVVTVVTLRLRPEAEYMMNM